MTNAEKYQKSIRKIINEGSLAVHRIIGEPYNCDASDCIGYSLDCEVTK